MKYEIFTPLAINEMGQRHNQEDTIWPHLNDATKDDRLFILCDGMGGHQKGEVASRVVCDTLSEYIKTQTDSSKPFTDLMLTKALATVYNKLNELDKENKDSDRKMGTTLVLLYFHAGGLMAAHIGDSRYYHIRPKNNEIVYRSKDHSLVNDLYDAGEINMQDIAKSNVKNIILRVIMPNEKNPAKPDIVHIKDIRPDDWFYMCSDGMLENIDDDELLNIICDKSMTDEQKRDWLKSATSDNKDNHSAFLIHINSVVHEIVDENEPDDESEARMHNKMLLDSSKGTDDMYVAVASEQKDTEQDVEYVGGNDNDEDENNYEPRAQQSKGMGKYLFIIISVVFICSCLAVLGYYLLEKKDAQKDSPSVEIKYEEIPSGNTVSRTRHEEPSASPSTPSTRRQAADTPQKAQQGSANSKPQATKPEQKDTSADGKTSTDADNETKASIRQAVRAITPEVKNDPKLPEADDNKDNKSISIDAFKNVGNGAEKDTPSRSNNENKKNNGKKSGGNN